MSSFLTAASGTHNTYGNAVRMRHMIGAANGYDVLNETTQQNQENFAKLSQWGTWIRGQCPWTEIEPNSVAGNRPNGYNWTKPDKWVNVARSAGLNIILTLGGYTPNWARTGLTAGGVGQPLASTANPHSPAFEIDFQDYIYHSAYRYIQLGVRYFEIGNEPNFKGFWTTGPNPVRYAEILKTADAQVKAAASALGVTVYTITGGTSPGSDPAAWSSTKAYTVGTEVKSGNEYYTCYVAHTNQPPPNSTYWLVGGTRAGDVWLEDVYDALDTYHAGARPFDHVAHHPYPPTNYSKLVLRTGTVEANGLDWDTNYQWNAFWGVTPRIRNVIVARENTTREKTVKVFATEAGAPSYSPVAADNQPSPLSEDKQTSMNIDSLNIWFGAWKSWTGPFMFFKLRDGNTGGPNKDPDNWGLYRDWNYANGSNGTADDKKVIVELKRISDKIIHDGYASLVSSPAALVYPGSVNVSVTIPQPSH